MRPFRSAAARAGRRSTCFQQDLHQVATGPSGGGIFHGPEHGASPSGARPPLLTSGRATLVTSTRQSTAESVNLLVGFQEEGEAHLEVYETSRNQPGSYVDLNDVLHMGPSTVELGTEDMETELSEGAQGRRTMAHLTRARGSSSSTVRALVCPPGSGSSSFTVPSPSSSSSSWVGLKFVHCAEAELALLGRPHILTLSEF